jgi:hypothetical protein
LLSDKKFFQLRNDRGWNEKANGAPLIGEMRAIANNWIDFDGEKMVKFSAKVIKPNAAALSDGIFNENFFLNEKSHSPSSARSAVI